MEKSIENIWKGQNPQIPKVEALYDRKSKLLIDRVQSMQKWDNRSLWLLAIVLLVGFGTSGHWILAFYSSGLMVVLYFYNRKMINRLKDVQLTDGVKDYLEKYMAALRMMVRHYSRLIFFGLPLLALPAISFWLHQNSPGFEKFIIHEPWYIISGVYLFSGLILGTYGWLVYRGVTQLIYGAKLRQLKNNLEELQALEDVEFI
jgi:hypothetical protein